MKKKTLLFIGVATLALGCMFGCASSESVEATEVVTESVEEVTEEATEEVTEVSDAEPSEEAKVGSLEDYYTQPEIKDAMDSQFAKQLEGSLGNTYSDISVDFEGNECIYSYTFKKFRSASSFDPNSENSSLQSATNTLFKSMRREAGVADDTQITVTYAYFNSDGSEIGRVSFTDPADDAEVEADADADTEAFVEEDAETDAE